MNKLTYFLTEYSDRYEEWLEHTNIFLKILGSIFYLIFLWFGVAIIFSIGCLLLYALLLGLRLIFFGF